MTRRKYTPVDNYAGEPVKVAHQDLGKGVELTTEQWPTLACKFTMSIPSHSVDLTELQANGWSPKLVGDRLILKHNGAIHNGWSNMIMREFVA
jgi:hypothetical protein